MIILGLNLTRYVLQMTELMQANREYREALALLVHSRELHTAAHLPTMPPSGKHRSKKQRSRRTRQKVLSMIGQPNSSSPSLAASDPSISSRPASLALPPGVDLGMFYPS